MCHSKDGWFQRQFSFLRRQFLQEGDLPFTDILTEDGISEAFTIARIAAIISLSCGAVLDLGICQYAGKGTGELSLLRRMWDLLVSGDVLLTDRLMCSWTEMVMLKLRGIDSVTRMNKRKADFRRGKRLGKTDHIVNWAKPAKPRSIDTKEYNLLPEFLTVREIFVRVEQPDFRTKTVIVATTMIDTDDVSKEDLAGLFRTRWNNELDLRTIKITLQMDILRCKTPELVRKEIWTHILAYNLIRTIIAQAASKHDLLPRSISFKGTLQTLEAFQPLIAFQGQDDPAYRARIYQNLLDAIAVHRVADRPDRVEPRAKKRRHKNYPFLMKSRQAAKSDILKGLT
jgi:hypothetical protein